MNIKQKDKNVQLSIYTMTRNTRYQNILANKKTVELNCFTEYFLLPEVSNPAGYPLNFSFEQHFELICSVSSLGVCLRFQAVEHFDIWAQTKILATDHHSLLLTTMFTLYDEALCLLIQNCLYQIRFTQKERCIQIQKLFC